MANASNYLESSIANWLRGTTFPTAPAAIFVGLFNGDPTDAGSGGTEVTTTIRVAGRVAVTLGAPSDGVMTNSAEVSFGTAAGAATVTHYGIFDAASSGNLLVHGAVGTSRTYAIGDTCRFAAGALSVTVA